MRNSILEEKRNRLGINRLSTEEQKKLFNDFVGAGGTVVDLEYDEKTRLNQKLEEWIRRKELEYTRHMEEEKQKEEKALPSSNKEKGIENKKANVVSTASRKKEENPTPYFISQLASKITCILYGIFPIFRKGFTKRFLELTFYYLQSYLLEAQQILYTVFQADERLSERIRKFLLRAGYTYYFEVVYRFYLLYDEQLFSQLFNEMQGFDPVSKTKPYFIELFKRILSIYRYYSVLGLAFEKILEEEKRICNIDFKFNEARLNKLQKISRFVFEKYFPKLLQLVDYYYREEILFGQKARSFKKFLNITEKDMMGYWNRYWEENEHKKETQATQEVNTDNNKSESETLTKRIPQEVLDGMNEINKINFLAVLNYFLSIKDSRMFFSFNDKIFITWVLLEYLDRTYSHLFLSNSVIFQVTFQSGQRLDILSNLKDLYFEIDSSYRNFYTYLEIVTELNKISTADGSKEKFSFIQKLELQRAQLSRKIRADTSNIIKKISENVLKILIDYNSEKKIVLNPDEIIHYEVNAFGKKSIINSKIIDLFIQLYNFAMAFYFLLTEGDLSGTLISVSHPKYLSWYGSEDTEIKNENTQVV
jgi:hypothetical protein